MTVGTYFVSDKLNSREFRVVNEGVLQPKGCIMGNMGKSETSLHYHLAKHQEGLLGKHKTPSCFLFSRVTAHGLSQYHKVSEGASESF